MGAAPLSRWKKEKRWFSSYELKDEVTWMGNNWATARALRQRRLAHYHDDHSAFQTWLCKQIPWESCYNANFDSVCLEWARDFAFLTSSWVTVLVWRPHFNSKETEVRVCLELYGETNNTVFKCGEEERGQLRTVTSPTGKPMVTSRTTIYSPPVWRAGEGKCGGIFQKEKKSKVAASNFLALTTDFQENKPMVGWEAYLWNAFSRMYPLCVKLPMLNKPTEIYQSTGCDFLENIL